MRAIWLVVRTDAMMPCMCVGVRKELKVVVEEQLKASTGKGGWFQSVCVCVMG